MIKPLDELKDCPFCGSSAGSVSLLTESVVYCKNDKCRAGIVTANIGGKSSLNKTLKLWNKRFNKEE